ncbi:uncharacterized protein LOC100369736 [Saccoglossus kowalevskii]|uniref:Uncharacterized protein LOC100369736 n=1 Tax=Saccoglossus kowalevskii TaxID=10224 RepID=A0ABM0GZL1_SACKO|nr:PREDICTED: uncharacterized protein LOC100369736 [Saccoglossus kowalevskii]
MMNVEDCLVYGLDKYNMPTKLVTFGQQGRFEDDKLVEKYCKIVVKDSFMDFNIYMSTLYGWVPRSMKPKRHEGITYEHENYVNRGHTAGLPPKTLETGDIIQMTSLKSGRYLRVHNRTGRIDGNGASGDQAKFIVQKVGDYGDNIITLRCYVNPVNYLSLRNGNLYANGRGDITCRFRFHLIGTEHMSFECVHNPCRFISVTETGAVKPITRSTAKKSTNGHFAIKITGQNDSLYAH